MLLHILEQFRELRLINHFCTYEVSECVHDTERLSHQYVTEFTGFRKKFRLLISHQGFHRSSDLHQMKCIHSWLISIRALFSTEGML